VRITLTPSLRKISSNAWQNFACPVVDEEPERLLVAQLHHEVARLLRHPTSIRIRRARDVLDPPGRKRDEEQNVDPL
jgi:hypothetical protein